MRLLLAIPYYAPAYAFGGSVTVAETIVEGFRAAGHEVTVATTDVLDERRRISEPRPGVVSFPNVSHRAAAAANLYAPRGLRGWLRANVAGFDAVLLHDFYSAVSVMSARAAARAGVPFVLQPLGTLSPAPERGRGVAKQAFIRVWGRRTIDDAAALIHSTETEGREFLAAGARADRLWHLPLPLELPEPPDVAPMVQPTVVYVGRLHPIKGLDRLIRACAEAAIRLEIAGPGERYQRELEELVRKVGGSVRFHGFVSQEVKLRLLASAHAFALLSKGEGLPMAALEAMACGTPVVLSEGCHMPDVHERAGVVVGPMVADAAAGITAVLADRERLGAGAREFAAAYRRERVMPQMVERFERLASTSRQ